MAGTEDKSEYCVCYLLENDAWRTTGTKGAEAVRSTAGASDLEGYSINKKDIRLDKRLDKNCITLNLTQ